MRERIGVFLTGAPRVDDFRLRRERGDARRRLAQSLVDLAKARLLGVDGFDAAAGLLVMLLTRLCKTRLCAL